MSSAFYPLGMNSYNNRSNQGGYKSWKASSVFSITAGNIRPLRNKDPTNSAYQKFGLPRPLQHYRKGIDVNMLSHVDGDGGNSKNSRLVKSSTGGGSLIHQLIDIPGGYIVKDNDNVVNNTWDQDYQACQGIAIVDDWQPIINLGEKSQTETYPYGFCCNEERNALHRVLPTSSNIIKNANLPTTYYTTLQQYRNNRCQTFQQKAFDFQSLENAAENTYNSVCQPVNGRCKLAVYKRNNPQFAQQGAVKSSTRTFKRATNTIQKRIALYNEYYYGYGKPMSYTDDAVGPHIETPFVLKYKLTPDEFTRCSSIKYRT